MTSKHDRVLAWAVGAAVAGVCFWFANGAALSQPLLAPPESLPPVAAPPVSATETATPERPYLAVALQPSGEILPVPVDAQALSTDLTVPPLADDSANIESTDAPNWRLPVVWLGPTPWETSIEFGLNGATGNSDSLSIRAGGHVLRESEFTKLDLDATYNRTTEGGSATQNNAEFDVRHDWLLEESCPWSIYGTANVFYDEFQAFDLQTSLNSGIGYRFVRVPGLSLIGRFGAGASREFGGPVDRWVPESLLGFEYKQLLSATQKVYGKLDYYPEWEAPGEYRLVADAGWEIAFAQPSNMSLKLSATDRFDSTPSGVEPHLVNYSVLLLVKL